MSEMRLKQDFENTATSGAAARSVNAVTLDGG